MSGLTDVIINFIGKDSSLGKTAGTLKKGVSNAFDSMKKTGNVALGIATGGLLALGTAFSDVTALAKEQQDVEKQLDAVLASTGFAAGLTADELKSMASELQSVTNFGDEAIINGQNLLLTFTNIGKDVFPRATETILDMSQALDQDLKGSAIQLGKALNDPVAGISALSDVGVSFTDQQKEMVAAMMEAGDIAGAQGLILDEMARQFGGSARALADPATQLNNTWGDFKEIIGGSVLGIIDTLAINAMPLLTGAMETLSPIIGEVGDFIAGFFDNIAEGKPFLDALAFALIDFTTIGFENYGVIFDIKELINNDIIPAWQAFKDKVLEFVSPLTEWIADFFEWKDVLIALGIVIGVALVGAIGSLVVAMAPIILTIAAVTAAVGLMRQIWENDLGGIRTFMEELWINTLEPMFVSLRDWFEINLPIAIAFLKDAWETVLLPAIQAVGDWLQNTFIPFITDTLVPWLQENIPAAIETLTDFWENTLLPALEDVWTFLSEDMMPIWVALGEFFDATFTVTLTALAGIWENVLLPALKDVRDYVVDKLGAAFTWLKDTIIDPLANSFSGLSTTIQDVANWISDLATKIGDVDLPDWMTPGSPTPWEIGLKGVSGALSHLTRQDLPAFANELSNVQTIDNSQRTLSVTNNITTGSITVPEGGDVEGSFANGGV